MKIFLIVSLLFGIFFFLENVIAQETGETTKSFKFINEKGEDLFEGKEFLLMAKSYKVSKETEVKIYDLGQGKWSFEMMSDIYFFDAKKNSTFTNNLSIIDEKLIKGKNSIVLSVYCKLQVIINYGEGMSVLPEDTECKLFDSCCFLGTGKITNGVAEFKFKEGGVFTIARFIANPYFSNFSRNVSLTRGETVTLELGVEIGKMQEFRLLDNRLKPLEGYYVYISRRDQNAVNIREIRNKLAQTGEMLLIKNTAISDKDGKCTIEEVANDEYTCYVFNKNISEQMFKIKIDEARKVIELNIKDMDSKILILKANLNAKPYLEELKFTYFDLSEFSAMYNKSESKFENGMIEIKNLKSSKYQFQLNSNFYLRELVEFDFREKNIIEYTFQLKPSDVFIHGFIKDKDNKPIQNVKVELSENKSKYIEKTNADGYYKIGGLEVDHTYGIWIDSDRPKPSNLPNKVTASNEVLDIVLDDKIFFSGIVLDLNGRPAENFSISFTCYEDKNIKNSSFCTGGTFKEGKFIIAAKNYGYFKLEAKIPNTPVIRKVFPVLKAEDNIPVILQAEPGFSITGTIKDYEGHNLEGVSVTRFTINSSKDNIVNGEILKTDKSGYFKLENCQVDEEYFFVKKGFLPISAIIKDKDKNIPLNLSFPKTYKLTGTLLTSDKKPHALVSVSGISKTDKKAKFEGAETGPDGAFEINAILPGEWYIYFNISLPKGVKKPGQLVKIVDKDEELHVVFDIPKD